MVFEIPVSVLKIPKFNRIKIKILPNNPKAVDTNSTGCYTYMYVRYIILD